MPQRGLRSTFKVTFRRFKTKKTCKTAEQVAEEEAKTQAGGRLRRVAKKYRLAVRHKVHRALNCMTPMRGPCPSQQRRHVPPLAALSRQRSLRTDQRSKRSEPVAEGTIVLRCARTPKPSDREKISLLDLPQNIRDKIFDRLINKNHFKVPPTSNHAQLSFATNDTLVSYAKGIPLVSHQFFDDFIAAVCRHPSCCMIITIQDMSKEQHRHRESQLHNLHPLIPLFLPAAFYPGDEVKVHVATLRAPQAYNQHIRDLRLHCIIDRTDVGPDMARSNRLGIRDITPSIQEILTARNFLPSLQHCDINVYFNISDVRGANYSLLWIDDCLKPLAILPQKSTAIQAVIPVTDSQDPKDTTRQIMKPWRVCPGGPEEVDWLHHGHARGVKDVSGVWNCYRCLRDHQLLHRYKRMERGWMSRREGSAYFSTTASRWRDEASGHLVTNVLHQVVDPALSGPQVPVQSRNDPRLEILSDLFGRYGAAPGEYEPLNRFTAPSIHRRYSS
ncbi:hypothetical protein EG328_004760 [Venturia inaequalis]|uniref:Uncharacterized protein n=1 Tax=Venturia inaequalis TaxID=5025 RepID=A0A8H3VFI5_VENIN|nr:hypothetical protein EG328_004760 [Venturia inaequalis]